jgi:hypothetical protein
MTENLDFFEAWRAARKHVSPGFTVLNDISRVSKLSKDWGFTSMRLHLLMILDGLAGVAEILPDAVADNLNTFRTVRLPRQRLWAKEEFFTDPKMAEDWLDHINA